MIERIIRFSIKNKVIVGIFVVALLGWGTYSLVRLPIDAIPDITNNQVQVISIAPSLAVQEVESFITAPIEVAVANIPDITELRSISRLGLSVVTVVFRDNVDIYWARQQLTERLKEAEDNIPPGVAKISLAPVSTGLGEIYQYRLAVGKGYDRKYTREDLRTLQDWTVRREMLGTPGVADVNSYGGLVKQYEVAVDPDMLRSMNLSISDIFDALQQNNENTGSAYIDKNPTAYFIRGIGLVRSLDDVGRIVVKNTPSGVPILIRDVAKVQFGNAVRYGALVVDTTEAVGGVVMMLKGANAHQVIKDVEKRVETIQKTLPAGVTIEPYLNRSDLVGRAIGTVSRNLIEGALIVIFILVLFLGNLRSGLIVASVIPLSMLFAVSMMRLFGVSGNLMSLGAIDFGLIVDGAVIIVESAVHRISDIGRGQPEIKRLTQQQMDQNVMGSAKRMMNTATFGQIIILIVYIPIMALAGTEGKMFRPMAQVVTFALTGAMILSLTYVPMISTLLLSRKTWHKPNFSDRLMSFLQRIYRPAMLFAFRHKAVVTVSAVTLFAASLLVFSTLGSEFIPQLEEGDLAAGIMTLQGGSLTHTIGQVKKANAILLAQFPEIKHTVCKIGSGEIPTDPTPMETGDYIITLKPKSEWTSASTREELVSKMEEALIPMAGVKFEFQQPIQMRFNELLSGSTQDVAVKIFGDDLATLADEAAKVEKIVRRIDGAVDINVEKVTGLAQVQVEYDRDALAQWGLSVGELNRVLRAAFAGSEAGTVFEGEKRFDLVVRLDKDFRQNLDDVKGLPVALAGGGQITFDQVADIAIKSGPAQVSREDTKRRISVAFNVRGRDIGSVIRDVERQVDSQVKLPPGYYIGYGGQFKNLEAAKARMAVAVPVALLLIFVLLFFTFHSLWQTLLIYTTVPMSVIGGILALWLRGMNFSISAAVGFIALFGIAVLNGIVLIAEFNRLEQKGITNIYRRVSTGLRTRLRPVLMTASVASLGFLPMALSTSAGAEVQRPLATVVIGGLVIATLLTLLVLPVFYIFFSKASLRKFLKGKRMKTLAVMALVSAATLSSLSLKAQQPQQPQQLRTVSMEQAVQAAMENNLAVRSAQSGVEAQKALKGAAWDIPKTSIEGEYGRMNSYTKDNSFTVSQSFAFPTVYVKQAQLAGANVAGSEWQHRIAQLEVATQVKQTYWQLVYARAKRDLLAYQDSLWAGFAMAAELRAKTGETGRLELISARSQSLEAGNQLRQADVDVTIQMQRLQTLLGSDKTLTPADTALRSMAFVPQDDAQDGAQGSGAQFDQNPSLGYANQQIEVARLEKELEGHRMLPDLSVGFFSQTIQGVQEVNGVARNFGPGNRFNTIQAGIAVPLFFGAGAAKVRAAKVNEQIAKTNVEYYSRSLEDAWRSQMLEYEKCRVSVDYYEQQAIPEANLIIEQATQSYKAGEMGYQDYIVSLSRALAIRQNYLDALNAYNQAVIAIEYITGKLY